jgi:hypothetical protein
MSEANFMRRVIAAAGQHDIWAYRNSVGLFYTRNGLPVRCGLCKDSADIIGFRPVLITPDMVGQTIAKFIGWETKGPRTAIRQGQRDWLAMLASHGGEARLIVEGETDLEAIYRGEDAV